VVDQFGKVAGSVVDRMADSLFGGMGKKNKLNQEQEEQIKQDRELYNSSNDEDEYEVDEYEVDEIDEVETMFEMKDDLMVPTSPGPLSVEGNLLEEDGVNDQDNSVLIMSETSTTSPPIPSVITETTINSKETVTAATTTIAPTVTAVPTTSTTTTATETIISATIATVAPTPTMPSATTTTVSDTATTIDISSSNNEMEEVVIANDDGWDDALAESWIP